MSASTSQVAASSNQSLHVVLTIHKLVYGRSWQRRVDRKLLSGMHIQ